LIFVPTVISRINNPDGKVGLDVRPEDRLPQLEELSYPLFSLQDMIKWGDKGSWENLKSLKVEKSGILQAFTGTRLTLAILGG
jgi:hypothetical protein